MRKINGITYLDVTDKKYELVEDADPNTADDSRERKLKRIRALRSFVHPYASGIVVNAGDLGGRVSGEHNLSHAGLCWITRRASVIDQARVEADALVTDEAVVSMSALVMGRCVIRDCSHVAEAARVRNEAVVCGNARVTGDAEIGGDAMVGGNSRVVGRATVVNAVVDGDAIVGGHAKVTESAVWGRVDGDAMVREGAHIGADVYVGGTAVIAGHRVFDNRGHRYFGDLKTPSVYRSPSDVLTLSDVAAYKELVGVELCDYAFDFVTGEYFNGDDAANPDMRFRDTPFGRRRMLKKLKRTTYDPDGRRIEALHLLFDMARRMKRMRERE